METNRTNPLQIQAWKESPRYLQATVLFFFAVALYINTITFDYALDDTMIITDNKFTTQGVEGIDEIMSTDAMAGFLDKPDRLLPGGRYRPLSMVMFALEYELWGLNPVMGHLINILLYALLGVSLFFLLRHMFRYFYQKPWYLTIPFLVTALFLVHPIHTEVVANIKGRDEILAMLFSVLSLRLILMYVDQKKVVHLVLAGVVFLLALLSKENAATMLAVVPFMIFVFRRESAATNFKTLIPLLAGLVLYALLRKYALGFWINDAQNDILLNNPFVEASATEKYATILFTWAIYLKLLFYPYPLTHDYYPYHIELVDFSNPVVIFSAIFSIGIVIFALVRIWKKDLIAFGILFFILTFSVSSNLVFNIGTFMNERFMFMPSLGFVIIIGYFFNQTLRKFLRKKLLYKRMTAFLFLLLVIAGSARTIMRNTAWKNDLTLFTTDVKTSSNSTKVNVSAGGKLMEAAVEKEQPAVRDSMLRLSEKYLKRGLRIYPGNLQGAMLLGQNYLHRKRFKEAYRMYDYVLDTRKGHANAYNNIHHLLQKTRAKGELSLSVKAANRLLKVKPNDKEVLFDLAMTYKRADSTQKAVSTLQRIIELDDTFAKAYRELGGIFGQYLNDMEAAKEYLFRAYQLEPRDYSTIQNLGIVYAQQQNFEMAIRFFKKAIEIDPNSENAYRNLMMVYQQTGQRKKVEKYARKVRELKSRAQ